MARQMRIEDIAPPLEQKPGGERNENRQYGPRFHTPIALPPRGVGVRPEQVAELAAGRAAGEQFDPLEELVLRFVAEVIENDGAEEPTVAELEGALSARQVIELLLVIAHYHGLALLLNTTGLQPDPPSEMAVVEAASHPARRS
jgi:hypothetical protein